MNTLDLLLKMDAKKLELPKKDVEIKRFSQPENPAIFTLQGLDAETLDSIRDMATKENNIDFTEIKLGTVLAGVVSPSLRDDSLMKNFGVVTPHDLIKKLFSPGELDSLYETISNLSGYGEDAIEEIKN
ncbi:XkdN-like protein [Fictibacillus nanhaiensis]|uniref:phage tail assembly chaperone n=1 Tax=Fictibacillus nanhaiensis TaxID=742169 RepID=UPI00203F5BAF|nr:XkdN-like protein [Fictibacillus nanhaiensis]MCM3730072.1 XkdN-like protein [Fictibacillus nanhaiensis]